jgi:hypothetical protein
MIHVVAKYMSQGDLLNFGQLWQRKPNCGPNLTSDEERKKAWPFYGCLNNIIICKTVKLFGITVIGVI